VGSQESSYIYVLIFVLVSASSDLSIRLWETDSWDRPGYSGQSMFGHEHTVSCARFLSTDDFIVSSSRDKTIKVWEVATKSVTLPINPTYFRLIPLPLQVLYPDYRSP
jgi:WD40 repeat protein